MMAVKEIPDRYFGMIIHFLMSFHNDTSEFSRPHLRESFKNSYKIFILLYVIIIISGIAGNILLLRRLFTRRASNISIYKFLAFNGFNDIFKCVFIMPLALSTTLVQNWVYGSYLCYLFPMMQDMPFHVTMLTFLLVAFDRYRQTLYPLKQPFPPLLCMISVWVVTVFAVLPYAVYTRYLDLETYFGAQFKGTGICAINVEDNIEEYIRGLFIIMYVLPLGLIAFMHIKATEEIKARQSAITVTFHEVSSTHETDSVVSLSLAPHDGPSSETRLPIPSVLTVPKHAHEKALHFSKTVASEDNKDWELESHLQSFLATAVTAFASCLLPLNLVRLLKHVVYETYENSFHFDISFVMVVWLAFIPTITTPGIFLFLQKTGVYSSSISRYLRLGRSSDVSISIYEKKNLSPREK